MARFRRFIFNIPAQTNDEIVYRPGIGVFVQVPDIFQNGFARNGPPRILNEVAEKFRLHHRKPQALVARLQTKILEIYEPAPETKNFRWCG